MAAETDTLTCGPGVVVLSCPLSTKEGTTVRAFKTFTCRGQILASDFCNVPRSRESGCKKCVLAKTLDQSTPDRTETPEGGEGWGGGWRERRERGGGRERESESLRVQPRWFHRPGAISVTEFH